MLLVICYSLLENAEKLILYICHQCHIKIDLSPFKPITNNQ
ncbi:hypothetical protein D1AOALGA4SA_195 [Olavius algarvensis Delta 1 endosymbiont]|nr:hypothetical protein D1AOALGA4SA_195 [Olavius algarvensis Delta 1 endosymbiont]